MSVGRKKKRPESYRRRDYRLLPGCDDLVGVQVQVQETDLHIQASCEIRERALELIVQYRTQLESYTAKHPEFISSLVPLPLDPFAPPLVKEMLRAGQCAGVGPMAAVAGGVAEFVGKSLVAEGAHEIIVENGGDIFLCRRQPSTIGIFAGMSPLSYKMGVRLAAVASGYGVCTSSGTIGHSLSLGEADSVTVLAPSTLVADAAATRLANEVHIKKDGGADLTVALESAQRIDGIDGVVIICDEVMGAVGNIELVALDKEKEQ